METSILTSIKKVLNIHPSDDSFDLDVIMHINAALATLNDVGLGPELGFQILDDTSKWEDLLGDSLLFNDVQMFIYQHVRLAFDPPATSFHLAARKEQLNEALWRIQVRKDAEIWTDPDPDLDPDDEDDLLILDAGTV